MLRLLIHRTPFIKTPCPRAQTFATRARPVNPRHRISTPLKLFTVLAIGGTLTYSAFSQNRLILLEKNVENQHNNFVNTLIYYIQRNDLDRLTQLLDTYPDVDVNESHPGGWNALHVACFEGNQSVVKLLLDRGADPNAVDTYKFPAKANAQRQRQALYDRQHHFHQGISPLTRITHMTPLHYACLQGNLAAIQLLCERGADPGLVDSDGQLPEAYLDEDLYDVNHVLQLLHHAKNTIREKRLQEEREFRRKFPLEDRLSSAIVGQSASIRAVASAVRRKQNGWHDSERPLVFLFLGSSGVGKTELAKQLAKCVHPDDSQSFIRIDMSEFQTKHEVSKFLGSPPGYVGYDEGGQLTEKLKKSPNAIVLMDEVEKAHPDILTVMLQTFDEGRLTDGRGETVDCRDAIFVMTSNLAQVEIRDHEALLRKEIETTNRYDLNSPGRQFIDDNIYPILRGHFQRDEFLGRINEILFFLPFNTEELKKIVGMELDKWKTKAWDRHQIDLKWTDAALDTLGKGYDVHYGARSVIHAVERDVVSRIAKAHELDLIGPGSEVIVYVKEDGALDLKFGESKRESKPSKWYQMFRD